MNRYEEQAEIVAVMTAKVDRYGRVGGMKKHRGRTVRVLILLEDPRHPRALLAPQAPLIFSPKPTLPSAHLCGDDVDYFPLIVSELNSAQSLPVSVASSVRAWA